MNKFIEGGEIKTNKQKTHLSIKIFFAKKKKRGQRKFFFKSSDICFLSCLVTF